MLDLLPFLPFPQLARTRPSFSSCPYPDKSKGKFSIFPIHIMVLVWFAADKMEDKAKEKSSDSVNNPRSLHVFERALRNMWYLKLYRFKQKNLWDCKLPRKPLYWFDEHRINPQLNTIVKLVQRKELDVLVDDDGGPIEVDAVATILASQALFFRCEQNPIVRYS